MNLRVGNQRGLCEMINGGGITALELGEGFMFC